MLQSRQQALSNTHGAITPIRNGLPLDSSKIWISKLTLHTIMQQKDI